jgi:hypothetical protein
MVFSKTSPPALNVGVGASEEMKVHSNDLAL